MIRFDDVLGVYFALGDTGAVVKALSNWLEEEFRALPAADQSELVGREAGYVIDFRLICELRGRDMLSSYSRFIETDVRKIVNNFIRPAFVVLGTPPLLQLGQLQIVFADSRIIRS